MVRSKKALPTFVIVALLLMISGCTKFYDIEYFSLLDDMTPSAVGKPELSDSIMTEEVPVEYFLERDLYVLNARIDSKSIPPSVIFWVGSKSDKPAALTGQHLRCFLQVQPVYDFEVEKELVPAGSIRATWSPNFGRPCEGVTPPIKDEMVIRLSVSFDDGDGSVEEPIHFKILKNGKHLSIDSF